MFDIFSHQENENQNYISPQSEWLQSRKQTVINAGEDVRKRNPYTLLVGM
jgi:hypothetical protein